MKNYEKRSGWLFLLLSRELHCKRKVGRGGRKHGEDLPECPIPTICLQPSSARVWKWQVRRGRGEKRESNVLRKERREERGRKQVWDPGKGLVHFITTDTVRQGSSNSGEEGLVQKH